MSMIFNSLLCLIVLAAVGFVIYKSLKAAGHRLKLLTAFMFLDHFCAFYFNWSINSEINRDSFRFFTNALEANSILDLNFVGSQFMSFLIYPFVKLGASYFSLSLVFASLSFIGFIKCIQYLISVTDASEGYFYLIFLFFIPSLHFWTAGLTKEALLFPLLMVVFFRTVGLKISNGALLASFIMIALIRPYLFIIIFTAFFLHLILADLNNKKAVTKKLVLFLLSLLLGTYLLIHFFGFRDISINSLKSLYEDIVIYSQAHGTSSIDLTKTNFFDRLLIVLFRPLFFDARTFYQFVISIENLFFLVTLLAFLKDLIKGTVKLYKNSFLWLSIVSLIGLYSLYMYNLGLASRMRVMFMPYIYFLIVLSYIQSNAIKTFSRN